MSVSLESIDERLARLEAAVRRVVPAERVRTLSVSRVVDLTGLPRRRVLEAIREGELPAVSAGDRTKVVRPTDLDQWLEHLERRP